MRDRHDKVNPLGDGRVSLPWPDCLHTSRNQDRRCRSQLVGGMVGRRPGFGVNGATRSDVIRSIL